MDIESVFKKVGNWGTYQKRLCLLVGLTTIPNGILAMLMVFTHETPPHRCYIPEIDNTTWVTEANTTSYFNVTTEANLLRHIPLEIVKGKPILSRCEIYVDRESSSAEGIHQAPKNGSDNTTSCQYSWIYDIPPGRETIVTKWDLVCDRGWIKPLATSAYMIGAVIAASVSGYISDRFGRQPTFFWSTILQGVFALLCGTSTNVPMYIFSLVICGGFGFTNLAVAVVLAAEVMHKNMRGIVGNVEFVGFAVGYMFLPLIAYLTSTWRHVYYILASVSIFVIPYWWLLLESPRWLMLRNRPEKAKEVLMKMAKVNGTWTAELEQILNEDTALLNEREEKEEVDEGNVQYSYLDIVRYLVALKRVTILSYSWIILNMTYYFFSYNTGNIGGNPYVNCLIAAATEIPAAIFCMFLMDYVGRTIPFLTLLLASSIACAIIPFLLDECDGRPEVFPTLMRNKAFGVASSVGRVGGILAPYFVYWGDNAHRYKPYIVMSVLCIIGAISSVLLPETKNEPVPGTMEEAKKLKTLLQHYGCRRRTGEIKAVKA